jgi:hypothetical protein
MTTIRWTRPTESGLGDRFYDLLFMAAYARVRDAQVYTKWEPLFFKDNDVAHRRDDILVHNVLAHIQFPREIVIDDSTRCQMTFDASIGAIAPFHELWNQHAKSVCSWDVFETAIAECAKGFKFCPAITTVLESLPVHFVSLHIRRGDKVRDEEHDGCFIRTDELDGLNNLTFRAIDWALKTWTSFFVCGDEDAKNEPFIAYIREKGGRVIEIPKLEKWRMTYYEMAVMTRSELNITSQRRSSFSSFPALIGKGMFRTVYDLEHDKLI